MNWSELQPPVRLAILAGGVLLVAIFLWVLFVSPMMARQATAESDLATAESQLEQLERQIESIPPAADDERAAWQSSREEMMSRLGPESELPLLLESLARLAEAQGVEIFITSGSAARLMADAQTNRRRSGEVPAAASQVFGTVPGASYVPLNIRVFGDHRSTSLFVSQLGRLGWATAISGVAMVRDFPEVATEIGLNVFFRPAEGDNGNAGGAPVGAAGARGGDGNG